MLCALRHGCNAGFRATLLAASCCAFLLALLGPVSAAAAAPDSEPPGFSGRLGFTGAVTAVEGAAGGGLASWALIGGLGTRDQWGAALARTSVSTRDFTLDSTSLTVGAWNRVEISFARQRFDAGSVIPGLELRQDVIGAKVRLLGDAIFDGPRAWPQIAVGVQHKHNRDFDFVPAALGARSADQTEVYVAATKLWFAAVAGRNLLLNATLRRTDANQYGLLGFGGPARDSPSWRPELSAGVFVTEDLLVGGEYRAKAPGLSAFAEQRALDVFAAWSPWKHLSLTAAWVDLGTIAGKPDQRGAYLSLWAGF